MRQVSSTGKEFGSHNVDKCTDMFIDNWQPNHFVPLVVGTAVEFEQHSPKGYADAVKTDVKQVRGTSGRFSTYSKDFPPIRKSVEEKARKAKVSKRLQK